MFVPVGLIPYTIGFIVGLLGFLGIRLGGPWSWPGLTIVIREMDQPQGLLHSILAGMSSCLLRFARSAGHLFCKP